MDTPGNKNARRSCDGESGSQLITTLLNLNQSLACSTFILPGLLATTIDEVWLETQRVILAEANAINADMPLTMTIALGANAARSDEQVASLLEAAEQWNPAAYYIVCEHPGGDYLIGDANWLANVLDLTAGLRLRGAKVVLGYCKHQSVIAACAKADAICSGTWMNVRSFPPDKFRTSYDEEIKQRSTWYYCPQALSEYKLPFLDIARRQGVLNQMRPIAPLDNPYVTALFSGAQPSTVGFTEQAAFRHYLHCLRRQVQAAGRNTFDETIQVHNEALDAGDVAGDVACEWCNRTKTGFLRNHRRESSGIVRAHHDPSTGAPSPVGGPLRSRINGVRWNAYLRDRCDSMVRQTSIQPRSDRANGTSDSGRRVCGEDWGWATKIARSDIERSIAG